MHNCINQIFYEHGCWFFIDPSKRKIYLSEREVFQLVPTLSMLNAQSLERVDKVTPPKTFPKSIFLNLKLIAFFGLNFKLIKNG